MDSMMLIAAMGLVGTLPIPRAIVCYRHSGACSPDCIIPTHAVGTDFRILWKTHEMEDMSEHVTPESSLPALLSGKRGIILGIANQRSIAFAIAKTCRQHGAELLVTYQNERLRRNVEKLAVELSAHTTMCDVTEESALKALASETETHFSGKLDFIVHAVAFAERDDLIGRFIDTQLQGFQTALGVSAYSLVSVCRVLEPYLKKSSAPAVLTLSYLGAERVVPNYNIMGVAKAALECSMRYLAHELGHSAGARVNAISAGPVKTLSAAAVPGLRRMLTHVEKESPLQRNISQDDVGRAALFALSDLGSGMTGEVIHVDAGYHTIGAPVHEENQ